jgi:hypothetical protein
MIAASSATVAIATKNPTHMRRWAISAAIVLLVHGVLVATVVTWRKTLPFGPIAIKLAPAPVVPVVPPTDLPLEQGKPAAAPEKPIERAEDKAERPAPPGDEKAVQRPAEEPRVTALPPVGTERENEPQVGAAPDETAPATKSRSVFDEPIQLVVPEQNRLLAKQHRLQFDKALKARTMRGTLMGNSLNSPGSLKIFAARQHMRAAGTPAGAVRNALGMPVQAPAVGRGGNPLQGGYQASQPSGAGGIARNAIGTPHGNGAGGPMATPVVGGVVSQPNAGANRPSASGAPAPNATAANRPIGVGASTAHTAGPAAPSGATAAGAAINGTGMGRPGTGTAVVGGPAKNSGVLNGTTFKSKRP